MPSRHIKVRAPAPEPNTSGSGNPGYTDPPASQASHKDTCPSDDENTIARTIIRGNNVKHHCIYTLSPPPRVSRPLAEPERQTTFIRITADAEIHMNHLDLKTYFKIASRTPYSRPSRPETRQRAIPKRPGDDVTHCIGTGKKRGWRGTTLTSLSRSDGSPPGTPSRRH